MAKEVDFASLVQTPLTSNYTVHHCLLSIISMARHSEMSASEEMNNA